MESDLSNSVCDHGIPDINVDFFFLKQCEYIQRNTIFSGNVHKAHAYPPTRNLFTEIHPHELNIKGFNINT